MPNEDETEDIVIEFEGNFDLDSVENKHIQIIGIDTDEPILKIDSKFYKVDIADSIGSRLIFDHGGDGKLRYHAMTEKVMMARRVMIKPK